MLGACLAKSASPLASQPSQKSQVLWLRKLRQKDFYGFKFSTSYTMSSIIRLYSKSYCKTLYKINIYSWVWWFMPSIR